jgi:hypothetical protein
MYTNNAELFITTDGGKSWHNGFCLSSRRELAADGSAEGPGKSWVTTGLDVTSCWEVVPDPATAGVLYAACSNTHDIPEWSSTTTTTAQREGGVCVSVDFGKTWKSASDGLPAACQRVTIDPIDRDTIWVATFGRGAWRGAILGRVILSEARDLVHAWPGLNLRPQNETGSPREVEANTVLNRDYP